MQLENTTLSDEQLEGLKKLRDPFPPEQISKLPKPTAFQTKAVKDDFKKGRRCGVCGGWHHPDVVHLDYVGHAALTSRLLDVDPLWNWEPYVTDEIGSPKLDKDGGMWIWLTVCGLTRRGYGDAEKKTGPSANKERIGDALRNAAMRFGAALDLWSKADLTKIEGETDYDTPKMDKENPVDPARKKVEDGLTWIDGHAERKDKSESLAAGWEKYFVPRLGEFAAEHQDELKIAYKDTMGLLEELETKGEK